MSSTLQPLLCLIHLFTLHCCRNPRRPQVRTSHRHNWHQLCHPFCIYYFRSLVFKLRNKWHKLLFWNKNCHDWRFFRVQDQGICAELTIEQAATDVNTNLHQEPLNNTGKENCCWKAPFVCWEWTAASVLCTVFANSHLSNRQALFSSPLIPQILRKVNATYPQL